MCSACMCGAVWCLLCCCAVVCIAVTVGVMYTSSISMALSSYANPLSFFIYMHFTPPQGSLGRPKAATEKVRTLCYTVHDILVIGGGSCACIDALSVVIISHAPGCSLFTHIMLFTFFACNCIVGISLMSHVSYRSIRPDCCCTRLGNMRRTQRIWVYSR